MGNDAARLGHAGYPALIADAHDRAQEAQQFKAEGEAMYQPAPLPVNTLPSSPIGASTVNEDDLRADIAMEYRLQGIQANRTMIDAEYQRRSGSTATPLPSGD